MDKDKLNRLVEFTQLSSSLTQEVMVGVARVEEQLKNIKEDVDNLTKTVKDGNGRPSLITQLALLEDKLANFSKVMDRVKEIERDEKKTSAATKIAIIAGAFSLLSACSTAFMKYMQ